MTRPILMAILWAAALVIVLFCLIIERLVWFTLRGYDVIVGAKPRRERYWMFW